MLPYRNESTVSFALKNVCEPHGTIVGYIIWDPTQLKIILLPISKRKLSEQDIEDRTITASTEPVLPPNSLLTWARENAIVPTVFYDSVEDFREVVTSSLQSVSDKLSVLGFQNSFWNISYDGKRIISRKPKNETDIQPIIHGLIFDIAIAKNLDITPEYQIAGGRLDFLFTGTLRNGKRVNVCVEFKHAHSQKLDSGLVNQLPKYMRSKGCEFGIYFVLYFKGEYFSEPENYDKHALDMHLNGLRTRSGLLNIRVMILDLTHEIPPSKQR